VDMQRMFAEDTPWQVRWLRRVLPNVQALVEFRPSRTVFTRFVPALNVKEAGGAWQRYYRGWSQMTQDNLQTELLELVPELAAFMPPARIVDKRVYSPWFAPHLHATLQMEGVGTVIVSGGETEVCVLATVLGAVDHGYRVIVARDALCSSADFDPRCVDGLSAIANLVARATGRPPIFILALATVIVWALTGPLFDYSDTWQLVINTGTTIVTFLMVFLIQNSQNRDSAAIQVKLDELIRASAAKNYFVGIEHLSDMEIDRLREALEKWARASHVVSVVDAKAEQAADRAG